MAIKEYGVSQTGSLPSVTGNTGKYLVTDGTTSYWDTPAVTIIGSVLGAGGTSFSFSNIPQTYKHLKLIMRFTLDSASQMNIQINDAGLTFQGGLHYWSSNAAVAGTTTSNSSSLNFAYVSAGSWATSTEINIPDYASSNRKSLSAFSGGTNGQAYSSYGAANQTTTSIQKITIVTSGGVIFTNYTATLYGWN